ncbi:hypothetical protein EDB19DRAFT_525938 [Suillus lakei]|nr:hypothetical protein EDB19DRAFT_525938 [Suillus lakei]
MVLSIVLKACSIRRRFAEMTWLFFFLFFRILGVLEFFEGSEDVVVIHLTYTGGWRDGVEYHPHQRAYAHRQGPREVIDMSGVW